MTSHRPHGSVRGLLGDLTRDRDGASERNLMGMLTPPLKLDARIAEALVRWRWQLLAAGFLLGVLAIGPARSVTYDRTIENMFAATDPLLVPHKQLNRVFQGNATVLGVYDDPDLMKPDLSGTWRLRKIRQSVQSVEGVRGVLSLEMPVGPDVVDGESFVHEQLCKLFEGFTHGADGRTACVACLLHSDEKHVANRETVIKDLRERMSSLPDGLPPGRVTGEPVMIHDAFEFIEVDGQRLLWATSICLGTVIYGFVRSLKWVIIPLLVVQLALLLTNGLLGLLQLRLSMVSSMLTAVVTVVGIGAVMHVIVHYRQMLAEGKDSRRALVDTLHLLAVPIFWACLTDAAGFASLLIAYVGPVREFGLMMAIGSMMVLVSAVLIIPGLALVGSRRETSTMTTEDRFVTRPLLDMVGAANRHSGPITFVTVILSAWAILGVWRLEVESDFTRNFRRSTEIVQSYEIVESRLGGAGVCDVLLPAPQELDWPFLRRVLRFESELRRSVTTEEGADRVPGLTKVLSLADAIYYASAADISKMRGRRQQLMINTGMRSIRRNVPEFFDALYARDPANPDQAWYRILLRAKERQPSRQKLAIIQQVEQIAKKHFPEAQVTGYFVLLTNLIDSLLSDQWRSFLLAISGIGLIMAVAFRDLRLVLIAMVPNVVPITVVMGLMGWFGFQMNMGAAMIAAVSIGLSVDSSIHYLIQFQRERAGGKSINASIEAVQNEVGKSMIYATVALMAGFSILASSQFIPTVYFGILMSASILFTLLGTLLWLPFLLRLTMRDG